jgi:hypothetical protein
MNRRERRGTQRIGKLVDEPSNTVLQSQDIEVQEESDLAPG